MEQIYIWVKDEKRFTDEELRDRSGNPFFEERKKRLQRIARANVHLCMQITAQKIKPNKDYFFSRSQWLLFVRDHYTQHFRQVTRVIFLVCFL